MSFIEKIAENMGPGFGVCDSIGRGVFPENVSFDMPPEEDCAFEKDGKLFIPASAEGVDLWFYDDVSEGGKDAAEASAKALKVAAAVYGEYLAAGVSRKNDFFAQLLTGGKDAVSQSDFAVYAKKTASASQEFTVLLVTPAGKRQPEPRDREDKLGEVAGLLDYAFPEKDGFEVLRIKSDECAVIVPLTESMTYDNIAEAAGSVINTAMSEIPAEISVSLGCRVKQIRNIDVSYRTAERALQIGEAFYPEERIYSYEKLGVARVLYGQKRDVCESYLREIFGSRFTEDYLKLRENGIREDDELIETVKAFFKFNQNISETAKALFVHRNTLNYRIDKFNRLTGLDCTKFEDGVRISIGFMIIKYLRSQMPQADEVPQDRRKKRD